MSELQINIFCCGHRASRFPFTVKSVNELNNIANKDKVILHIHGEVDQINAWKEHMSVMRPNITTILTEYSDQEYMKKVRIAQTTDCKYSCKLDDDVLVGRHVWDYMIENLGAINQQHPIISPILTNGMPSVYFFIEDFLSEKEKQEVYRIFLNTEIENHFSLDYSEIDKKVKSMKTWNDREYWDFVATANTGWERPRLPWYYFNVRGIHPARLSEAYNMYIATKVIQNKEKFFGKNDYRFDTYVTPYFTNNVFISETKYWKDTSVMYSDGFDEGQLSTRLMMDNASILYVRNGFGIHMAYGHTHNSRKIEQYYTENI